MVQYYLLFLLALVTVLLLLFFIKLIYITFVKLNEHYHNIHSVDTPLLTDQ